MHFRASALKTFPKKNFWYFFLKNLLWKGFLYFLKKAPNFQEAETLKKNSLYFRKWDFQALILEKVLYFRK